MTQEVKEKALLRRTEKSEQVEMLDERAGDTTSGMEKRTKVMSARTDIECEEKKSESRVLV